MVEYRGQDAGQRRFRMAGEEMAVGLKNAFFILFCYPMRPYIYSKTLRVYLPKVFCSRASKPYAYLLYIG
jgi:hypothetical protein